MAQWDVIVSNVGIVYSGTNGFEARKVYFQYRKMSQTNYGRVAGESVSLMKGHETHLEYISTIHE